MNIEKAREEDIPALCGLLEILFTQESEFQPNRSLHEKGLREIIRYPERGQILVLRDGTSIRGMANMLFTISTALGGRTAILEDVIIHPEYRGKGAGSSLLEAVISHAKSSGCLRITLMTDHDNEAARRLYVRHGFKRSDMITMRLIFNQEV